MEIRSKNATGNAGAHETITTSIDITTIGASKTFTLPDSLIGFNSACLQAEFVSLTGTKDATVEILQSNRMEAVTCVIKGSDTLDAANGTKFVEVADFTGSYFAVKLTKNSCSGGTITLSAVFKAK
jgi:hypothetical protein